MGATAARAAAPAAFALLVPALRQMGTMRRDRDGEAVLGDGALANGAVLEAREPWAVPELASPPAA